MSQILMEQTRPYLRKYVEEHHLVKQPPPPPATRSTIRLRWSVGLLLATNLLTASVLGTLAWDRFWEREFQDTELDTMASYAGTLQAGADIRAGRKRIYEIYVVRDPDDDRLLYKFTGRMKGPFQIWTYPQYPILGTPHKRSTEAFVTAYNSKMTYHKKVRVKKTPSAIPIPAPSVLIQH